MIVVVDVVWRRIGGQALIGAVDLTQLCVMAAAFLSIPYAFVRRSHVVVDLLAGRLSADGRRLLDLLGAVLSTALLGLILYLGWGRAMEQLRYGDVSQDLAIPMIWYWGFLLTGAGLSVLAAFAFFLRRLVGADDPPVREGAA
nr:TRAP transporter small permease [Marivibrio halodurans]